MLDILSVYPTPQNEKPRVVVMKAKAGVASKMISIAEIAKREIGKGSSGAWKWFQYSAVEVVMEEVKKRENVVEKKDKEKGKREDRVEGNGEGEGMEKEKGKDNVEVEEEEEEETTAFETMKTPFERANEGRAVVRAVPVMRIYLSRVRIDGLRKAYG